MNECIYKYNSTLSLLYVLQQRRDHLCGTQHAGDGFLTVTVLRLLLGRRRKFGRFGLSMEALCRHIRSLLAVSSFPLLVDF